MQWFVRVSYLGWVPKGYTHTEGLLVEAKDKGRAMVKARMAVIDYARYRKTVKILDIQQIL